MKLGIETMVHIMICLIGLIFALSIYVVSLEAADAKQYHVWTMEKLEGSKYAKGVQEYCMNHAKEQGYTLEIEEEEDGKQYYKKVILKYHTAMPFSDTKKTYQIIGYSHWKGGDEI